jgi:hypothetical protein
MSQYLVSVTKNISINTFSCKTSRESVTWETQTWKCVNGVDKTGPTAGFCGHNNKFLGSYLMTKCLLPSSPQHIPDQTIKKESVPPFSELSCEPNTPTIINHTGAHPSSRLSKVRPRLNCVTSGDSQSWGLSRQWHYEAWTEQWLLDWYRSYGATTPCAPRPWASRPFVRRHLVPSAISRGALCQATPETSVSEERKRARNVLTI